MTMIFELSASENPEKSLGIKNEWFPRLFLAMG
jgi:hypothetical protein